MDIKFSSSCTKDEFLPAKSIETPWPDPNVNEPGSPLREPLMNPHLAALKLQKTYKSFRTRRQLADCAILAEHRWWNLLDFAELKCSSVSYFEPEKPETAVSRWSRARSRAAKVGKGSSRHAKACKLALQHWLEAIDPRHRYGHNLHFYFVKWLHCQSRQPFFYWLDIGEGKEGSLERCPRPKLQKQCIRYLSPIEREAYEVTVEDGKFIYKLTRKLIDTRAGPTEAKWIFVLNTSNILYVGMKRKGKFQHSSFLAGGATLSAGQLVVIDGMLKAAWPHSGHYLPTKENFDAFMLFLEQHHINVQTIKNDEEEVSNDYVSEPGVSWATEETDNKPDNSKDSKPAKLSNTLEILEKDVISSFQKKELGHEPDSSSDEDEPTNALLSSIKLMASRKNLFGFGKEVRVNPIPEEKIIQAINSHKETRFFRLPKHLGSQVNGERARELGVHGPTPLELQFQVN